MCSSNGVIENKLWSTSKAISAQSGLVDYERGLCASQFMDYMKVLRQKVALEIHRWKIRQGPSGLRMGTGFYGDRV